MPETVSYNTIKQKVVKNWCRLMRETATEKGDDLSIVAPFTMLPELRYGEVMQEIRANSDQGIEYYRKMVRQLPWYVFEKQK